MTEIKQKLFDAFKADHALLGAGFFGMATCLRNNDIAGTKALAAKINIDAGPHIAFEEEVFYPALQPFMGNDDVEAMLLEHENGRMLLEKLMQLDESTDLSENRKQQLLTEIECFESHISECGELFGMMGGLSDKELKNLYKKLMDYRLHAPNWLSRKTTSITTKEG